MKKILRLFLPALPIIALAPAAQAEIQLPSIVASNMVLQQNQSDAIWGWDTPGAAVTVSFRGVTAAATAGADGKWMTRVPGGAPGGPFTMVIKGSTEADLTNILVGEVWVTAGQSNMWWHVGNCKDAPTEIKAANYPQLRYWDADTSPNQGGWPAASPQKTVQAEWQATSPQNVANFAGVPYFFARDLYLKLNVPVGIVNVSVPGVEIEKFVSQEFLRVNLPQALENRELRKRTYAEDKQAFETAHADWLTKKAEAIKNGQKAPPEPQAPPDPNSLDAPASQFNGTVYPAAPFTSKGFLWWQGEYNADRFLQYRVLFPGLIQEWRQLWGEDEAPFLFVELHGWLSPQVQPVEEEPWPDLRDAQREALRLPNTFEVSTIDILDKGESIWAIHPANKQLPAHRLFLTAMANVYGDKTVEWSGPVYKAATFNGRRSTIRFDHVGAGLTVKGGGELKGFALAGPDRVWRWARAEIVGETVVLSSDEVPNPVAARYDWANNPNGNLYNNTGLPAFAFRTDMWNLGLHTP